MCCYFKRWCVQGYWGWMEPFFFFFFFFCTRLFLHCSIYMWAHLFFFVRMTLLMLARQCCPYHGVCMLSVWASEAASPWRFFDWPNMFLDILSDSALIIPSVPFALLSLSVPHIKHTSFMTPPGDPQSSSNLCILVTWQSGMYICTDRAPDTVRIVITVVWNAMCFELNAPFVNAFSKSKMFTMLILTVWEVSMRLKEMSLFCRYLNQGKVLM